jgi:hypothetical protein
VAQGTAAEPPAAGAAELVVQADEVIASEDSRRIEAQGHVRVTYQNNILTADRVVIDQDTETAVAEGHARLTQASRELQAERLEWHYTTQVGSAVAAETRLLGSIIVRGQELLYRPDNVQAARASFTTCDRPHPHYRVTARSITVIPGRRAVARGVGLWLFGVRLLTVPRLTYSLRPGQAGRNLFPIVGYNNRDGVYFAKRLRLIDRSQYTVTFDGRLALKRGLMGSVEGLQTRRRLRWIGAVGVREQAPNQRVRYLDMDRLPELGLLWTPKVELPSRFLPHQVQDVSVDSEDQDAWQMLGQFTVGYFRQHQQRFRGDVATSESDLRFDARFMAAGPALRIGNLRIARPRALARSAYYAGGDHLTLLGFGLEHSWKLGRHASLRLERFGHWQQGESRFFFDRTEIRNEWRPSLRIRSGLNTFTWFARYDADRHATFDQEFGIARVLHCFEPRLVYHTRRRQLTVQIAIPGLREID